MVSQNTDHFMSSSSFSVSCWIKSSTFIFASSSSASLSVPLILLEWGFPSLSVQYILWRSSASCLMWPNVERLMIESPCLPRNRLV